MNRMVPGNKQNNTYYEFKRMLYCRVPCVNCIAIDRAEIFILIVLLMGYFSENLLQHYNVQKKINLISPGTFFC